MGANNPISRPLLSAGLLGTFWRPPRDRIVSFHTPGTGKSDILIASTPLSQYELALISWGGMPESKKGFNRVSPYYLATLLLVFPIHSMKTANTNPPTSLSSIILQNSLTSSSSIRLHLLFIPLSLLSWPRPSPFFPHNLGHV